MSWLIKTAGNTLEIWTDQEYTIMKEKCEYYGAAPYWQAIRHLEDNRNNYIPPEEIPTTSEKRDLAGSRR